MNNNKIFFFWIELLQISPYVLKYIPSEYYNDPVFILYILSIYDINLLYKVLNGYNESNGSNEYNGVNVIDVIDVINSIDTKYLFNLNSIYRYQIYLKHPEKYKFILTEDLIIEISRCDLLQLDGNAINVSILVDIIQCEFNYMLPNILKLNYRLYFFLPIETRSRDLFDIVLSNLYIHFKCDESVASELEQYYYYETRIYDDLPLNINSSLTLIKCELDQNISYMLYIFQFRNDIPEILEYVLSKMKCHYVHKNIVKYLTVDMCDIIIQNTINNTGYTYISSILMHIPIELISTKSAHLMLLNESPHSDFKNSPLFRLINLDDFIKICTTAGLYLILDIKYHTYDIYYNFIQRVSTIRLSTVMPIPSSSLQTYINFKLLDSKLLYEFIRLRPCILNYLPNSILENTDVIYVIEKYIFSLLKTTNKSIIILDNILSMYKFNTDALNYLIYKIPILELYINQHMSFEKFTHIIYSYIYNLKLHEVVISRFINNFDIHDSMQITQLTQLIDFLLTKGLSMSDLKQSNHVSRPHIPLNSKHYILNATDLSIVDLTIDDFYAMIQNKDKHKDKDNIIKVAKLYSQSPLSSYKKWIESYK